MLVVTCPGGMLTFKYCMFDYHAVIDKMQYMYLYS